jgi:ligand-binding SRPBCC domain-containing protein
MSLPCSLFAAHLRKTGRTEARSVPPEAMSDRYQRRTRIAAPASVVFGFHERPDAFARLAPPWQPITIVQPPSSLAVGTRVVVRAGLGPLAVTIVAEHVAYEPGRSFTDTMVEGPFRRWLHRHIVEPDGDDACVLVDDVEYELPLGAVGRLLGSWLARRELDRMFIYRHEVTRAFCEAQASLAGPDHSASGPSIR